MEKITEKKTLYKNDADRMIGISIVYTNANLSGALFGVAKDLFPVL